MIVIGCSHGKHIAKKIAKKSKRKYSELFVERFPDNELHIKFNSKIVNNQRVVLVQSFYGDIDSCLIEVMFAARTARNMGASSDVVRLRKRKESLPQFTPEVTYRSENLEKDGIKISRDYIEYNGKSIFEETQTTPAGSKIKKPINSDEDLEFFCSLPIETDQQRLEAGLEKKLPGYLREKEEFPEETDLTWIDHPRFRSCIIDDPDGHSIELYMDKIYD